MVCIYRTLTLLCDVIFQIQFAKLIMFHAADTVQVSPQLGPSHPIIYTYIYIYIHTHTSNPGGTPAKISFFQHK